MTAYALYNFKGGVGKTTTCVNLAYLAAAEGYRTLVWDVDPQGAASFYLKRQGGLNGHARDILKDADAVHAYIQPTDHPNLDIIPGDVATRNLDLVLDSFKKANKKFKNLLQELKSSYDYIFIDCPPSLSRVAENLFRAAHFILFPMIPSPLSERTYGQVSEFFAANDYDERKLFPFFNLVDRRRKLHKEIIREFSAAHQRTLHSYLPNSATIERMGTERRPLPDFAPRHETTRACKQLWQDVKLMRKPKSRKEIAAGQLRN